MAWARLPIIIAIRGKVPWEGAPRGQATHTKAALASPGMLVLHSAFPTNMTGSSCVISIIGTGRGVCVRQYYFFFFVASPSPLAHWRRRGARCKKPNSTVFPPPSWPELFLPSFPISTSFLPSSFSSSIPSIKPSLPFERALLPPRREKLLLLIPPPSSTSLTGLLCRSAASSRFVPL